MLDLPVALQETSPSEDGREGVATIERRGLRLWVVPHSHWDWAWYMPEEDFHIRLARTLDEIVLVLSEDPEFRSFTLDGQAALLEVYRELRPEMVPALRALMKARRIEAGFVYTSPDFYLAGPETLVRNVLTGGRVCREFGGTPMNVWYAPDNFGHIAQTPQLARGLGKKALLFSRGLGDERHDVGAAFLWEGPDGSVLPAIRQLDGYGNASSLGHWSGNGAPHDGQREWADTAIERIEELAERHRDKLGSSPLADLLLCNGTDHERIQTRPYLPALLKGVEERVPAWSARIATYEEYVDHVLDELDRDAGLAGCTVRGELCAGGDMPVLRGVNSTRMYLKQANEAAERALLTAETLYGLASLAASQRPLEAATAGLLELPATGVAAGFPHREIDWAWKQLLLNQPHDSISGCSVDEVHEEMMARYRRVQHIAARLTREAISVLAGQVEPWSYRPRLAGACSLVNSLPYRRTRVQEIALPVSLQEAPRLVATIDGEAVPVQLSGPAGERKALVAATLPGFGSATIELSEPPLGMPVAVGREASRHMASAVDERTIENEYYVVRVLPGGDLEVTDRSTGRVFSGLHYFLDEGDRGDEYNFCSAEDGSVLDSRDFPSTVRVIEDGPVRATLLVETSLPLPRGLTPGRDRREGSAPCTVQSRISLCAGVDRVHFSVAVDNQAQDHRLRAIFPSPDAGDEVRVESHYMVLRRPARPESRGEGWAEAPFTTHHTLGLVAAGDLAVMTRGLPEYEAIPDGQGGLLVAVTLLRCVGWLSRGDLGPGSRPGHAGPMLPAPGAQCPGTHVFEYALNLRGATTDAALVRMAQDYRYDFAVGAPGAHSGGLLEIEGEGAVFSALKDAEDGRGTILRIFNPGAAPARVGIAGGFREAAQCTLAEQDLGPVEGAFDLRGYEIAGVRLR